MDTQNRWHDLVVKANLAYKEFDIKEVNNFEAIQSLFFDREKYPTIIGSIKDKSWDNLKEFENEKKSGFGEYLDIIKFSDQNHKTFVATIYDSDELWQDPEIIEIITLTN